MRPPKAYGYVPGGTGHSRPPFQCSSSQHQHRAAGAIFRRIGCDRAQRRRAPYGCAGWVRWTVVRSRRYDRRPTALGEVTGNLALQARCQSRPHRCFGLRGTVKAVAVFRRPEQTEKREGLRVPQLLFTTTVQTQALLTTTRTVRKQRPRSHTLHGRRRALTHAT